LRRLIASDVAWEMTMIEKPRIKLPKQAKRGEIIQIKTLISHIMENGQRRDKDGNIIPRKIINAFSCQFNGQPVFSCDLDTAVAANPYLQFTARIEESGTFRFTWRDDDGSSVTADENITVIP
jgi:sulfur-oxidizing protein SoxZ